MAFSVLAVTSALATTAHATVYNVTGSLTYWHDSVYYSIEVAYPNGIPTFTGTVDDVSGAYNFSFGPFTEHAVHLFMGPFADITTTGQVLSGIGDGVVSKVATVQCVGDAIVCSNLPFGQINGSLSFSLSDGVLSGILATNQASVGGIADKWYSFSGTAVPIPATAWLFGSGLMGLLGVSRQRKTARTAPAR